jgi:hypothetical protein
MVETLFRRLYGIDDRWSILWELVSKFKMGGGAANWVQVVVWIQSVLVEVFSS